MANTKIIATIRCGYDCDLLITPADYAKLMDILDRCELVDLNYTEDLDGENKDFLVTRDEMQVTTKTQPRTPVLTRKGYEMLKVKVAEKKAAAVLDTVDELPAPPAVVTIPDSLIYDDMDVL